MRSALSVIARLSDEDSAVTSLEIEPISCATTEKLLPASPARAASSRAFIARIWVRSMIWSRSEILARVTWVSSSASPMS